jgi:hypothetical protein
MATIIRPAKTAGTRRYSDEVEAGADIILATEVDADVDLLYATINALDGANLEPGAVGTDELADLAVTTPKLADLAVTTPKLADLAVTLGKMAVGGARQALVQSPGAPKALTATEQVILSRSVTSRGGSILLLGTVPFQVLMQSTVNSSLAVHLRPQGSPDIRVITFTLQFSNFQASNAFIEVPGCATFLELVQPGAGTFTYEITARLGSAANVQASTQDAALVALELA